MSIDSLIYDWNRDGRAAKADYRSVELDDETLRDGLQGPSVRNPPTEIKKRLLHLMDQLGIDSADIGLPGASERARTEIVALAKETTTLKRLRPNMALRTHPADVKGGIEAAQQSGVAIEACAFIGSSPIRRFAEDWSIDTMLRNVEDSVTALAKAGLPVMFVTEDTTRANPETIRALYTTAIRCGARAVCVCDTVGHATPDGAREVVKFVREIIDQQGEKIRLDWHGHQDRGLGVINSIAAIEGGADQVHGSALGMGERVGNTPMDQLLVNLKLMGWIENDLTRLREYCDQAAEACRWTIPLNYPVFGRDAFRTATGVHAAAVIKSYRKGDTELTDLIY